MRARAHTHRDEVALVIEYLWPNAAEKQFEARRRKQKGVTTEAETVWRDRV